MEGETTALYLNKLLNKYKIKITRIAKGLPTGSEIEYADELTLGNALKFRIGIGEIFSFVSFTGGSEQGVHNRMYKRVTVRMPLKPSVRHNLHAAQIQGDSLF